MKIGIIGAGYVGLITATVLASKNRDKEFIVLDNNEEKIKCLNEGKHYIKEPLFEGVFETVFNKNLILTLSWDDIDSCDIIFIAVPTPDINGHCNLSFFNDCLNEIQKHAKKNASIIVKSTVPVGTTMNASKRLRDDLVLFNIPEFLAERTAIKDLMSPVRVLIGRTKECDSSMIKSLFDYCKDVIVETDSNTSELIKLSSNFLLAQRISSINAIEAIAKQYNANIVDISKILRMDKRIGNYFLSPSAAFGGSCFRKDINNLSSICNDSFISNYIRSVNTFNEYHALLTGECVKANQKVLFLGYGFKNESEDIRESPTEMVIKFLPKTVKIDIYDPHIEKYSKKPKNMDYDWIFLMNDEDEYIEMIRKIDSSKIINTRYSNKI